MSIWDTLKIEPTRDEDALKKAYRKQLVTVHPEDDPEGFRALRAAYEEALQLARQPKEDVSAEENEEDLTPRGDLKKAMQTLYASFFRRVQVEEWEKLLNTPYVTGIDTAEEAMVTVLDFLAEHYLIPHQVFRFIYGHFNLNDRREELLERYPYRYLDYIQANATYPDAVDFTLFEGPEDYDYDTLIGVLSEFSRANKSGDLEKQKQLLPKLQDLPVRNPDIDTLIIRFIWQDDRREEAEEKLDLLEQEYPDCFSVLVTKGDILQHTDRLEEAERYYKRLESYPAMSQTYRGRMAELRVRKGEYEKARDTFFDLLQEMPYDGYYRTQVLQACEGIIRVKTEQLGKSPEDMKLRTELAAAQYQSYHFEEAISLLGSVAAPADPVLRATYYNYLGRSFLSLHRPDEALAALSAWVDAIRDIPEEDTSETTIAVRKRYGYALSLIGVAYMQKQDYESAGSYLESALTARHDEYLVTMEEYCVLKYLSGAYAEGIEACKALELRSPQNFQASNIRAKCNFRLGYLQEAMEYAERAASVYPFLAEPYYLMAKCMLQTKAYREAEKLAERYLVINPGSDTVHLIRALILEDEKKDWKGVAAELEKIRPHLSDETTDLEEKDEVYRLLGDAAAANGKATAALEYYEKAVQENHRRPALVNRLANMYRKLDRYEEALKAYRMQGELEEDHRVWLNQAFCLMQLGRRQEARETTFSAVQAAPENYFNLRVSGRLLLDLGYARDAVQILERAGDYAEDAKEHQEVLESRLRGLVLLREYDLAQAILQKVKESGLLTREMAMEEIELLTCMGRFRDAENAIRMQRWRSEEQSRMYDLLCKVRFRAGDLEGLMRLMHEIEGLESRGSRVATAYQYELLGQLQMYRRKFKEAEQSMLTASNRKPNRRYRYLGYMAECASRQFGGRSRMLRYVASLERNQITGADACASKIRLAQGMRAEKSYEKAHLLLEEVLRTIPENDELNDTVSEAYEELGWLYLAEKKRGEALLAFEKADDTRGYDASLKDVIMRLRNDSRN